MEQSVRIRIIRVHTVTSTFHRMLGCPMADAGMLHTLKGLELEAVSTEEGFRVSTATLLLMLDGKIGKSQPDILARWRQVLWCKNVSFSRKRGEDDQDGEAELIRSGGLG